MAAAGPRDRKNEVFLQNCEKLFWPRVAARRRQHSGAVCRPRNPDRDVQCPIVAFECKIDRGLLSGMELLTI